MEIGDNTFLIKFSSRDDKDKALALGHWIIGGQLLLAEDWTPSLRFPSSNVQLVRIWLALPNLPSILRTRKCLIAIASVVGTSLEFDLDTAKCNKMALPRLRVHIDISTPVKLGTWINFKGVRIWQQFSFEGIPPPCHVCNHLGHGFRRCALHGPPVVDDVRCPTPTVPLKSSLGLGVRSSPSLAVVGPIGKGSCVGGPRDQGRPR